MADLIYLYKLATAADMAALKGTWERLGYAAFNEHTTVTISAEGFITMQRKRAIKGPLPADEAGARKAGDAFLKKLIDYAGNLEARPRALVGAVFQYTRFVNARPPADSGGSWRLLYRPYLRGRRKEQGRLIDDRQAYIALEIGGNGLAISFEVHLRPVVQPKEVKPLPVTSTEGLLRLPDSEALLVTYRVDLEGGYYAPYYVRAAQSREEWQRIQKGDVNGLLVPAARESKVLEGSKSTANKLVLTEKSLKAIAPEATDTNIKKHLDHLNRTFEEFEMDRPLRAAHFLAQVMVETGSLRWMGQTVGSGYNKGRGMLQLTSKGNYEVFTKYMKKNKRYSVTDFEGANVALVEQEPYASVSAAWYWTIQKTLNAHADENDFIKITYAVNTRFNGYDERLKFLKNAFKEFGIRFQEFKLEDSVVYDDARGALGWGLWHDPGLTSNHFDTCSDDVRESIKGYRRFLELPKQEFAKYGNWYELTGINEAKGVVFNTNEPASETFAKYRLKQLGA